MYLTYLTVPSRLRYWLSLFLSAQILGQTSAPLRVKRVPQNPKNCGNLSNFSLLVSSPP